MFNTLPRSKETHLRFPAVLGRVGEGRDGASRGRRGRCGGGGVRGRVREVELSELASVGRGLKKTSC